MQSRAGVELTEQRPCPKCRGIASKRKRCVKCLDAGTVDGLLAVCPICGVDISGRVPQPCSSDCALRGHSRQLKLMPYSLRMRN